MTKTQTGHGNHGEDCLKLVPIFKTLAPDALAQVSQLVHEVTYPKGTTLFSAGESATALTIIASGQAKVYQLAANGREQLLYLLQSGDFDGEAALFNQSTRTSFAETLVESRVCTIARADFQQLLQTAPQLALNLVNAFGQRISQLETKTTAVSTTSIEGRLAGYLVETAASFPAQQSFTLPMPKKEIAVYLGTTPETVSRKLLAFQRSGWIEKRPGNQIIVRDADQLAMLM
ncbi:Crp/Fnr family transcriptional regulator [Furfurilactobacillus entadae]|uniref:Crp/Fnr family transcriptional regulator n=1 Tax=Furfurilactobacillus entadae TaxID=2922307 RepID=UPI0035E65091